MQREPICAYNWSNIGVVDRLGLGGRTVEVNFQRHLRVIAETCLGPDK